MTRSGRSRLATDDHDEHSGVTGCFKIRQETGGLHGHYAHELDTSRGVVLHLLGLSVRIAVGTRDLDFVLVTEVVHEGLLDLQHQWVVHRRQTDRDRPACDRGDLSRHWLGRQGGGRFLCRTAAPCKQPHRSYGKHHEHYPDLLHVRPP